MVRRDQWNLLLRCRYVLIGAGVLLGSAVAADATQGFLLDDYPVTRVEDLDERYKRWVEEEVYWILTEDERDVFLRLGSNEQRDRFIAEFWRQRDPSPGTEANEYRDRHYELFEYASENFGRDTPAPGWRTDRGRVWITLGRPQSMSRLPNTSLAVPVEVWFYSVDPASGLPPFFYLIFFKDRGVGAHRLYSPSIDGPERLLNAAGQRQAESGRRPAGSVMMGTQGMGFGGGSGAAIEVLRQVDAELGNAAASLIPGEGAQFGVSPLRSEMVVSQVLDYPARLMPRATWAYKVLAGVAESEVRFETLPMAAVAIVLLDPAGSPFIHYATRTPGDRLNLSTFEDRYYVTFDVSASLRDDELRFVEPGATRTMQADLDEETARRLRTGPVQFMDRLPAIGGEYTLGLVLENNVTREFARADFGLEVQNPEGSAWVGAPLLVLESQEISEPVYDPYAGQYPFQVGRRLLIPALGGPFPSGGTAWVFRQVQAAATVPEVLATYSLRDVDRNLLVEKVVRIDSARRDARGVMDHLVQISLADVPAGRYVLTADLDRDGVAPTEMPLEVVDADDYERPYVHALQLPPASSPAIQLARARQMRTVGRTDDAIAELDGVLRREPDLEEAFQLQVDLLTDAGRFEEVNDLLTPRLVQDPNDKELLLRLAGVGAELGRHHDAIRYFERALLAGAEATPGLLNSLASEYYAQGDLERVRELLEQSLQLEPDQPQMRRLLDEVIGRQ